jgi:hypothetical protein
MGSNSSTDSSQSSQSSQSSSLNEELIPFLPYIYSFRDDVLSVDPDVILVNKPSNLPSAFIEGRSNGAFCEKFIPKGTVILKGLQDKEAPFNDGAIDLRPLLQANNSEEAYQAWKLMKNCYYDINKFEETINTIMVSDINGNMFFETIKDVPVGTELVRVYGFTSWTLELLDLLTDKNWLGFAHFIDELSTNICDDPYEQRIKILRDTFSTLCPNFVTLDRTEYDLVFKDKPTQKFNKTFMMIFSMKMALSPCGKES